MAPFSKILIANRGEIAVRIHRSARSLGYRTVAIYSDADRASPHVALADEAVSVGGAAAAESYLNVERVLGAAAASGAEAVHPGYGFLSENAAFAEACAERGLTFIGPPASAIRLMGNKAAAIDCMTAAGVACLPGYRGAQDDDALVSAAQAIGFPVMLKAAAGGGGKGMRLVAARDRFREALAVTRAEARRAFGSEELLVERALLAPRHVEIQIFADGFGNVMQLGERDCSVQRRHQKVIEEAPSPAVPEALRERMGSAAIEAARAVRYVGAGTVEFLLDASGAFFFLEMNTRLQVEHAVTEAVTGIDLVAWQLRAAAGETLGDLQATLPRSAHAIEARLYAEDPERGFLPQAGRIVAWEPPLLDGVRVDHALAPGAEVSPFYDPLLAKVVAAGANREEARRRLLAALEAFVVFGIPTNRDFLIDCLREPVFARGEARTDFVSRCFPALLAEERTELAPAAPAFPDVALAAVLFELRAGGPLAGRGWRSNGVDATVLALRAGGRTTHLDLEAVAPGSWSVAAGDDRADIEVISVDDRRVRFAHDGIQRSATFAWDGAVLHLRTGGRTMQVEDAVVLAAHAGPRAAAGSALSPMPGIVVNVLVRAGDRVERGQCLVVLEAMKMLHEVAATGRALVAGVLVAPGQQVGMRATLVELEALAS